MSLILSSIPEHVSPEAQNLNFEPLCRICCCAAHSEAVSDITEITGEESTGDEYDWDPYYFIKTLPPLSE